MIGFVVPFRPKSESKDWQNDCLLLQHTVDSLLNQLDDAFEIFVVYTDEPSIKISDKKVHLVHFPFPFTGIDKIEGHEKILHQFNNNTKMFERRWDKGRKICYGSMIAKKNGHKYIMSVDADDLVSNKLVQHLRERTAGKDVPGFYIEKGYLYSSGASAMIKVPEKMHLFNGSTHILREEFVPIPDFSSNDWHDYSLFTSHGWIRNRLKDKYGIIIEPISFPAIIYIAHSGNISKVNQLGFKDRLKRFVKLIVRRQPITSKIRAEFLLRD